MKMVQRMLTHCVDLILLKDLYCGQAKSDSHVASSYKLDTRHNITFIMEKGYQIRSIAFSLNPSGTQKKKNFTKTFMGCSKIIIFPREKLVATPSHQSPRQVWGPKVTPSRLSHHREDLIHRVPNFGHVSSFQRCRFRIQGLGQVLLECSFVHSH